MGVVNRAQAKRMRSGGPDLISRLPDEILGSIISLLPTEQGARTQILSSRWRPLWRSAPLNLEPYGLASGINEDVVSRILTEHRGGARRFKAPPHILHGDPATLDRWLRSPVLNDLQELRLYFPPFALPMRTIPQSAMRVSSTLRIAHFSCCQFAVDAAHRLHFPNLQLLSLLSVSISDDCLHAVLASCLALDKFQLVYCYYISPKPLMPPSTLRFSSTLRVARFGHCQFPDAAALKVHFPNLQYLELRMVTVSERSLHAMLSSCPALNNLILTANFGFRKFMINSLKLKRVEMCFGRSDTEIELEELIVVNAPCLEILDQRGPYVANMHISIVSAPKLKILARLNDNTSRLELGTTVFEGRHAVRVATTMRSVKVLALKLHNLSLHMTINFMKCFPCLEKLYIKTRISTENVELHNSLDRNECLDFHLKKLRIRHYSGKRSHLAFARFFVLNASVLESLVLIIDPEMEESDSWIEKQRRKLQLEKRASIGCEIKFSSVGDSSYHSDIQDLSEPFE
ncbi:unnamed protein product [Urochloa decumbens]|uniref:FBD domain-containing protein n=1 Tax=Urochloa decumbens TaxID=240449 RepID=A0ABC9AHF4_9POAL